MENTEHVEQERVEPALLSLCTFSKDHLLRCKGMDSIRREVLSTPHLRDFEKNCDCTEAQVRRLVFPVIF